MKSMRTYKFRIYPTPPQSRYIEECIHSCWWFYRYVLHHYEDDYAAAKRNYHNAVLSYYYMNRVYHPNWFHVEGKINPKIPNEFYPFRRPIRYQGVGEASTYKLLRRVRRERLYLNNVPAIVLQEVLERIDRAFKKFFQEGAGYPRYPKERDYHSISWTSVESINFVDGQVWLSKFPGLIKIKQHRQIQGKIKRVNISRDILGQYYAFFMCEDNPTQKSPFAHVVGIDMNMGVVDESYRKFITLSTGEHIDIPRWYSETLEKIKAVQKRQSVHIKGSQEWVKHGRKVKHMFEHFGNKRDNWLHNLTHNLATRYQYVVIEDLNLTEFRTKRKNWKEVSNSQLTADRSKRKGHTEAPHGEFKRQLSYKLRERLILVSPEYTTKTCSVCGRINNDVVLGMQEWICPGCGRSHDRDINAAKNILYLGLRVINGSIKNTTSMVEPNTAY